MALVDTARPLAEGRPAQSFFSPLIDFLCLGGGSLLLLPILTLAIPDSADAGAMFLAVVLANFINHPHFAYSYQIFYRTFGDVMRNGSIERSLRNRYAVAGVAVPVALALFFVVALLQPDARLLGYGGNAMMFFVGWHYVKQGYGMLMVDAAMKKSFFGEPHKKVLLWNSFAVWITSWLYINKAVSERDLWGLAYATFGVPDAAFWLALAAVAGTSAWSLLVMIRHSRAHGGRTPINGIAAYIAALYPWLFLGFEPVLGVLIPAMHSLQYQIIVWRYQLNVEHGKPDADAPAHNPLFAHFGLKQAAQRFAGFCTRGMVLGAIGFWVLPFLLSHYMPYDRAIYGHHLFFFVFVIFINIHHYFIDNAMWRKENPHTLKQLFAHR
ncbi:MAG: hypothetical protein JNN33_05600 [Rhodospirillaceae bacterium]|nr:hypothetical protein [Rhodospirillaceae bacterium]